MIINNAYILGCDKFLTQKQDPLASYQLCSEHPREECQTTRKHFKENNKLLCLNNNWCCNDVKIAPAFPSAGKIKIARVTFGHP